MEFILLLSFCATIAILCGISIGAVIDDIRTVRRQQAYQAHAHKDKYQPTVSVLLSADPDAQTTRDALESISESSYRPIEIILIGARHQRPELKKIAAQYDDPSRLIAIYTGSGTPNAAYRRYGKGRIILVIESRDRIDHQAIERSVRHFHMQSGISELRTSTIITTRYSTVGLLQTYANTLAHFWNKFTSVLGNTHAISAPSVSFHRTDAYLAAATHSAKTYFAEDVIVYRAEPTVVSHTLPKATVTRLSQAYHALWYAPEQQPIITWCRRLFTICLGYLSISLPLLLSYIIYLAVAAHQPLPLFIGVVIIGTCIILGLWSQPGRSLPQKLRLSFAMPICFIPFYILSFIIAVMTLIIGARTLRTYAFQLTGTIKRSFAR